MKIITESSKPVKVRKRLALQSVRDVNVSASKAALSSDLKTKYGSNSVRLRPGDSIRLVRGEYSGVEGKVQKVFPKEGRVTVEGVTREKIKGGTTSIHIHTSSVIVTSLNLEDKFRRQKMERSA